LSRYNVTLEKPKAYNQIIKRLTLLSTSEVQFCGFYFSLVSLFPPSLFVTMGESPTKREIPKQLQKILEKDKVI
jgi:hypothetical protein